MPIHKLEELSWKRLEELDRARALVILPVSPLEEHGPHLPLGVDLLQASYFAEQVAHEVVANRPDQPVLLHPAVPLGTWTLDFLGSLEIRQRVIRDLIIDIGASLARHGFKKLVVMNGHGGPGHIVAQEEACARLRRRHGITAIAPVGRMIDHLFTGQYLERILGELKAAGGSVDPACLSTDYHAGAVETSLMLHICPHLVTEGYAAFKPVTMERTALRPSSGQTAGEGLGYLGSPAQASRELGAAVARVAIQDLTDVTVRLLDGHDVGAACSSRYARIPLFWTDGKVYAGGLLLTVFALLFWLFR